MQGTVHSIYISDTANGELISLDKAECIAGRGILGDRYYLGKGTFSERLADKPFKEITLIEAEEIDAFNQRQGLNLHYADFRRNIITRGIRLNDLVDTTFYIGELEIQGIKLCEPCPHLAKVLTPNVIPDMLGKAGLRASIKTSGQINTNDIIQLNSLDNT